MTVTTQLVATDPWWDYARAWATALRCGAPPASVAVYGPILDDDEQARLCTTATSSRLAAGDGTYQRSSTFIFGSAGLTLGMLAAQGVINSRRKRQARRDEIPQWRYQQQSTVIVTDERLMCSGPDGTLIDFWFGYVTEFYPDLLARTLTFAFGDRCLPLQVAGPSAAAIALWSAHALYGQAWTDDVRLQPLLDVGQPRLAVPTGRHDEWVAHHA